MARIGKDRFLATGGESHPLAMSAVPIFLGIIDSDISGRNRTGPQKCRQRKPPMLIHDLAITLELDTLPIHSGQSGKQNRFWMSVGIEGKVSSSAG